MRRPRGLGAGLALALGLMVFPGAALGQVAIDDNDAGRLYMQLAARLDLATHRASSRLAQVTIDPGGDATVVFAILDADEDAQATRAGALRDAAEIMQVAFTAPEAEHVQSLTVLGTFPFKGTKGFSVRESPVMRVVISADTAGQIDWAQLTRSPSSISHTVDQWWMQGAFASALGASDVLAQSADNTPFDLVFAHLDETLRALSAGDVQIARSQFTQFFDAWDETADRVADAYPAEFDTLDVALERAEVALLHTQPADVDTASAALAVIRATLAEITLQ